MFFSRQKATLPRQEFFLEKSLREAYIKANLLCTSWIFLATIGENMY
jgi:hypothetical protein